jgi:hypothetical protein
MIWLKKQKLVFVKIPKNGSEAIAMHLQTHLLSPEDVYTHDNGFDQNIADPHRTNCHMDVRYILGNNLCDSDNTFIGFVRDPIERLLSLYLYRHRQGRYSTPMSVEDFRSRAQEGFIQDHTWQMQLQSTFLSGTEHNRYLCFDNLDHYMKVLTGIDAPMQRINASSSRKTRDLIDIFYDTPTLRSANKYWSDDVDLYHEVKDAETKLDPTELSQRAD